jgi:hypothetical protein
VKTFRIPQLDHRRRKSEDEKDHELNSHPSSAKNVQRTANRRYLTEVPQYQEEAKEGEDDSGDKDIHILRAERKVSPANRRRNVETQRKKEMRTFFDLSS